MCLFECDLETSKMKQPRSELGCCGTERKGKWHRIGPIPVAARSRVWICGYSLARIAASNPVGGLDVCLL